MIGLISFLAYQSLKVLVDYSYALSSFDHMESRRSMGYWLSVAAYLPTRKHSESDEYSKASNTTLERENCTSVCLLFV